MYLERCDFSGKGGLIVVKFKKILSIEDFTLHLTV
jgi:hypothetical protein